MARDDLFLTKNFPSMAAACFLEEYVHSPHLVTPVYHIDSSNEERSLVLVLLYVQINSKDKGAIN